MELTINERRSSISMPGNAAGVKILAVDDHPAVREALRDLIAAAPDFVLVGLACSGEDAVRDVARLSPQLVVMDVVMPGIGGIEAARTIVRRHPGVAILLISVEDPSSYLDEQDRSERIACLRKQALSTHELSLVWSVLSKETVVAG
ncbi:MAG TPA: response regulator transcription factor [Solirubrobacteraceae bacterium]|nr:response regulator transcription factor [Solirubrobacteraceae bacterium]